MTTPKRPTVAILGATGLIGSEIVQELDSTNADNANFRLFATQASRGEVYQIGPRECEVEELNLAELAECDLIINALPAKTVPGILEAIANTKSVLIDTGNYSRQLSTIKLCLPGINTKSISLDVRHYALPTAATFQLTHVLHALKKVVKFKHVVVSTYSAVSDLGKGALDELWEQARAVYNQSNMPTENLGAQLAFNTIPVVGALLGVECAEEVAIREGVRSLLEEEKFPIAVTAVRVPVLHAHGMVINILNDKASALDDITEALRASPVLEVYTEADELPFQIDAAASDRIHVARIRQDDVNGSLSLWCVADNIRLGLANQAVQLAELVLGERGLSLRDKLH